MIILCKIIKQSYKRCLSFAFTISFFKKSKKFILLYNIHSFEIVINLDK